MEKYNMNTNNNSSKVNVWKFEDGINTTKLSLLNNIIFHSQEPSYQLFVIHNINKQDISNFSKLLLTCISRLLMDEELP